MKYTQEVHGRFREKGLSFSWLLLMLTRYVDWRPHIRILELIVLTVRRSPHPYARRPQ